MFRSSLLLTAVLAFGALVAPRAATPPSAILETAGLRLTLSPESGGFEILDQSSGVTWRSNPFQTRFGEITYRTAGELRHASLKRCQVRKILSVDATRTEREDVATLLQSLFPTRDGAPGSAGTATAKVPGLEQALELTFYPVRQQSDAWFKVILRAVGNQTLEFSYEAAESLAIESVRLLDQALWLSDASRDYAAVPVREGLLVPANSGKAFVHTFDTYAYEGCHMEMLGLVKKGAAALLTWQDPYVAVELQSVLTNAVWVGGNQVLAPSLRLRKSARSFRLQFLGRGGCETIAGAYQATARERGWLVPWDEKLKNHPERARLFGAINFKLWSVLDRRMNEASTQEERVRVNWTFDEAAQVAEHLKHDLQLEKVLFTMGGWIHRGYDNQHPDILPTAPECGGDEAFSDCARRVRALGYLFCLHDNYQDIYRDAPSWNENLVMKHPDGSLVKGGHWAGGLAYLVCSQKGLELAERPQNLPAVEKLSHADAYFIDTTYAAGLQECFDPHHPLTRADDLYWKQALSDYARGVFGIFGSECGREWAIPHSDFFEGLTGVSGHYYHDTKLIPEVGGVVVPLFEMVYRNTIALYGKYGYDLPHAGEYVAYHISIGRPLNYHNVPPHLYWKESVRRPDRDGEPSAVYLRADHGWAEGLHPFDRFVKNTAEILSPLNEITARDPLTAYRFLTSNRKVIRSTFGKGATAVDVVVNLGEQDFTFRSEVRGEVVLPPFGFLIESSGFEAFLAKSWNGKRFSEPTLFTLRSQDGQPLERSKSVRVYHGFGDRQFEVGGHTEEVPREGTVAFAHP